LNTVYPAPALDGFRFNPADLKRFGDLTGVSVEALVTCNKASFRENILFTHAGLSGPAALQASLYWEQDDPVEINFLPSFEPGKLEEWFLKKKGKGVKAEVKTLLGDLLPQRLAECLCLQAFPHHTNLLQLSDMALKDFAFTLQHFTFSPPSTIGYSKAEVTRGGVDTNELSSKTMECRKVPGLYFIGEVVDVTGWLGGYNFQWAWSSGWAAGQAC
ncbi:MAG TPA: aminoacetone oxidase family FAD-binding enzyme, partial [bacterium]|nr:aminoacetone oxidase family FAD-binding enzyme [bacterium]